MQIRPAQAPRRSQVLAAGPDEVAKNMDGLTTYLDLVSLLIEEKHDGRREAERLAKRFGAAMGAGAVVSLHSGMTNPQRLKSWLAAHSGQARIVLGTRLAILSSLPHLKLIVIDEEHDPSYKQQEGLRYSAGLAAAWISPLGPLKFSYGQPINEQNNDKIQKFQFQLGTTF